MAETGLPTGNEELQDVEGPEDPEVVALEPDVIQTNEALPLESAMDRLENALQARNNGKPLEVLKPQAKTKPTNQKTAKPKGKAKAKPSPKASQKKPAGKTKKVQTKTTSNVKKQTAQKTKPPKKEQKVNSKKKQVLKMTKKDVYSRAYHTVKSSLFVEHEIFMFLVSCLVVLC